MTVGELRKVLETVPEDYRVQVQAVWSEGARQVSCLAGERMRVRGHSPREGEGGRLVIAAEAAEL